MASTCCTQTPTTSRVIRRPATRATSIAGLSAAFTRRSRRSAPVSTTTTRRWPGARSRPTSTTCRERKAIGRLESVVREELNVHEIRFVSEADELGEVEVKPNYPTLGPRFGKQMPLVTAAIRGLEPSHVTDALRDGRSVAISV